MHKDLFECIFNSLGYLPRYGITGSYSKSV